MKVKFAPDVQEIATELLENLPELCFIDQSRITYMRSYDSKANAIARIWELPRIWQQALEIEPHYVIEVLSQHFDKMPREEQEQTIIHEFLHIPKKFSGALVPHKCFGKIRVGRKEVERLHGMYREKKKITGR
ncbi:MAG: putative metallopeptidase [Candidatus Micrarchaeota archaeon]